VYVSANNQGGDISSLGALQPERIRGKVKRRGACGRSRRHGPRGVELCVDCFANFRGVARFDVKAKGRGAFLNGKPLGGSGADIVEHVRRKCLQQALRRGSIDSVGSVGERV